MSARLINPTPAIVSNEANMITESSPHPAGWTDLKQRFAFNPHRAGLADRFEAWVAAVSRILACEFTGNEPAFVNVSISQMAQRYPHLTIVKIWHTHTLGDARHSLRDQQLHDALTRGQLPTYDAAGTFTGYRDLPNRQAQAESYRGSVIAAQDTNGVITVDHQRN